MQYQNPVLPGMHPDPSICRVGKDYYLVTSSFEYFPGIPVFRSQDLIHWEQIGHCIDRESQLILRKGFPGATGLYAPTIRFSDGIFYVVCTNVAYGGETDGNFFVWTKNPHQKNAWSDPVHLDTPGIDPSFFFEDGHAYYTGAAEEQIFLCEINLITGKYISEPEFIWSGTGSCSPEGPHLYKKDDWYYLMISEGGTELTHMVTIARSREIKGPYTAYEKNPILSNRGKNTVLKATGHADIFQDQNGSWWAVSLGIRCISYPFKHNLGRETMLMPVIWEKDEWPVLATDGILEEIYEAPSFADDAWKKSIPNHRLASAEEYFDDFSENELNPSWNYIYHPLNHLCMIDHGLNLTSNGNALNSENGASFLGRRQEHHFFHACTKVSLPMTEEGEEAGLTIYLNHRHHYEIALARIENKNYIITRKQIGSLSSTTHMISAPKNETILQLGGTKETYTLSYSLDGSHFIKLEDGETAYLTTETGGMFTGNYIGLYTVQHRKDKACTAVFHYFHYKADTVMD